MNSYKSSGISIGILAIICYIFTTIISWSYGSSFVTYVSITISLAIFVYARVITKPLLINRYIKGLLFVILFVTIILGFINGDYQSAIMVNTSLFLPIAFGTLNINYNNFVRNVVIASLLNLVIIYYLLTDPSTWNSNCLAFMIFCGLSMGMIWFKSAATKKSTICSVGYLALGTSLLLTTGCRNAGMVIVACFVLLLLPKKLYENALFFRLLYLTILLTTVFASEFMLSVLNDEQLMVQIQDFTTSFSQKDWGMGTHYEVLQFVSHKFANRDLFSQLFGTGVKTYHCHNLYYQCLLFYGYVGTFIIYVFYMYVFEKAYILIKYHNDIIVLSCFIVLIGHFLLQIGEVYMLGAETTNLMALLPTGIILQRLQRYKNN